MNIHKAKPQQRKNIVDLLRRENLPIQDLPEPLDLFWVAIKNGAVVGAIGLERYGDCGLLRSMVVDPAHRSKGVATQLVEKLEKEATQSGITCLYLLSDTAATYFERKGYTKINRDNVPTEIKGSSEFSSVCPVSATVMLKPLNAHEKIHV